MKNKKKKQKRNMLWRLFAMGCSNSTGRLLWEQQKRRKNGYKRILQYNNNMDTSGRS